MSKSSKGAAMNRMGTRQSPQPEDHITPPKQMDLGSNMENLLAEVNCMSSTLLVVAADVSAIKETTTELKNSFNAIQERVREAEGCLASVEDTAKLLMDASKQNNKRLETLWNRVKDLENRS
ncbi:hypothetical protein LDENG_00084040 [Lucifuga dentata]|nr:hypothetical protein LDENG_00084040 [Lucifuga dentata]